MELRQLKYFLSAARHLSFTEAAKECCIVQSAMSQQIRALEKELDVTLFERTRHGLKLTHKGEALQQEATLLLKQASKLYTSVQQATTDGECLLRVGCQGGLMRLALPRALEALRKEHPGVNVWMKCALRRELLDGLRDGTLDCAIMLREDAADDGFLSRTMSEEPMYAALPATSPLVTYETLTLDDLSCEPLLLCASAMDIGLISDPLRTYIDRHKPVFVDTQSAAEMLVAAGCGVSLCVRSAARLHPNIVYRTLPELPMLHASLVWPGENPLSALSERLASLSVISASEIISVL